MPPAMTAGQNPRGAGPPQPQSRSQGAATASYTLAQTLPSAAPPPRYAPPQVSPVPRPFTAPGQSGAGPWRGGDGAQDGLIFRDRHGAFRRGTNYTGTTWTPGAPNTLGAGAVRPDFYALNRTWNYQAGTGAANADDLSRPYTRVGEKGTPWVAVYGGAPGFHRMGPGGPPVGDPSKGPARVTSGPPHGYHTHYPPERAQSLANFRARPQMVAPRVDRLSNSRIAGQNYSQWTQHQGGGRR